MGESAMEGRRHLQAFILNFWPRYNENQGKINRKTLVTIRTSCLWRAADLFPRNVGTLFQQLLDLGLTLRRHAINKFHRAIIFDLNAPSSETLCVLRIFGTRCDLESHM